MKVCPVFTLALLLANSLFADNRPNILFAFADDWGHYASAYAALEKQAGPNSVVKTANFDRIANEGVLFTNAFVNSPSCTPCRSSLLSGQYFFRTGQGAILQGAVWDDSIPSFPLLLRDAGHHIGQTYKVWSPGSVADAPFGARKYEYESAGSRFNQFSQTATKLMSEGATLMEAKRELYEEVLGNFESFLKARPDGAPFCYWFGPTNVHRKWTRGSGKALWGLDPDDLKGKLPAFLPDVHTVREDMADYLGEVMAFDAALGVLLERHVWMAREGNLPYPHRAIRTDDFLYIRNFKPDRYPGGDPLLPNNGNTFSEDALSNNTFVTFADIDAGPTKAWLVLNGETEYGKKYYDWAFGKRPGEELYDLRKDPDQIENLATDPKYGAKRDELRTRLLKILRENGDPRVLGDGSTFDKMPYTVEFRR